jgi:hypothetical protein
MKKVLMGAAALAMMVPGAAMAAQDGTPGATSNGSFSATLNVQPPTGVTVQVLGLDDFDFGTINTATTVQTGLGPATVETSVGTIARPFCLLRSDAGNVRVNVVQTNLAPGQSSFALLPASPSSTNDRVLVSLSIINPGASGIGMLNNAPQNFSQSAAGCSTSSTSPTAHTMQVAPSNLPSANTLRLEGAYTAQFTMTVSVP